MLVRAPSPCICARSAAGPAGPPVTPIFAIACAVVVCAAVTGAASVKECANCRKSGAKLRCTKCLKVVYCNRDCQVGATGGGRALLAVEQSRCRAPHWRCGCWRPSHACMRCVVTVCVACPLWRPHARRTASVCARAVWLHFGEFADTLRRQFMPGPPASRSVQQSVRTGWLRTCSGCSFCAFLLSFECWWRLVRPCDA